MRVAPYGTWASPITAEMAAGSAISFQDLQTDNESVYWSEARPNEAGRVVICKSTKEGMIECLPAPYSARSRVHEYGGGAFAVRNNVIYFVNDSDQRVYQFKASFVPEPITPLGIRFADLKITSKGLIAIAESHQNPVAEPENYLAYIDLETKNITKLSSNYDFYASVVVSQSEKKIAWIAWSHPNMPWDNTTLWVADFNEGKLTNIKQIDPTVIKQSFFQPQFSLDDTLFVVSDRDNWWNLYEVRDTQLIQMTTLQAEIGQPMWVFGLSKWTFYQDGIVFAHTQSNGIEALVYYHRNKMQHIMLPFTGFSHICTSNGAIVCFATSSQSPTALVEIHLNGEYSIIRSSNNTALDKESISVPIHIAFLSRNNRQAYAYFYFPKNKEYKGAEQEKPPLIVICHGGPTARANDEYNLGIQYWTSRGFAIVDVNYAGSTGYGRAFRESLRGNWGVFEVEDCIEAAQFLAQKGWVDGAKMAISGGSAGGLTVLLALANSKIFCAGCVRFGVTDLNTLVKDTHKFESHYLDRLIGPYPEQKKKYDDRSPINHIEKIHGPIIFFHGDEDRVVPLSQAQQMIDKLTKNNIACELIIFKGEQHGFRQAKHRCYLLKKQKEFLLMQFNK